MERVSLNKEDLAAFLKNAKLKEPNNFISMAEDLHQVDDVTDGGDTKELWLLQVPKKFDVSALRKLNTDILSVSGTSQTLKVKTEQEKKKYTVASFRDSTDYKNMCMVVRGSCGQVSLGEGLQNMLVVTERAQSPKSFADNCVLEPKKRVLLPTDVRVRFTAFGAGTPCPSVASKSRKRKKESSKGEQRSEEKKRKKDGTASEKSAVELQESAAVEESVIENALQSATKISKKRKQKPSPDDCDSPSPLKKKRKKHRHSEATKFPNGDVGDTTLMNCVTSTSPPSKHKKHKHRVSEGDVHNSSFDGKSSVVDLACGGQLENEQDVSDSRRKYKKKNSKKEHNRKTT